MSNFLFHIKASFSDSRKWSFYSLGVKRATSSVSFYPVWVSHPAVPLESSRDSSEPDPADSHVKMNMFTA